MKIFIDTLKWAIVHEERESPFYMGENNVSRVRIYFNSEPDNWYPVIKFLLPNGRRKSPINYDVSGYGVETIYNIPGYESAIWHFFDFTVSAWKGILVIPGDLQMTAIVRHCNDDGITVAERMFNFKNLVCKTTSYSDGNVIVIGDDP